ncbi:hypothetical protein GCM10009809_07190 [Isoptericola hypogeus]|uniref:Transcriptional regulator, AbiEi antitoxin, Type IV TA system n=1 Tax=Isoptericola hypogeus TaxID=300179 RepID=A0ABN2IX54_9MICO
MDDDEIVIARDLPRRALDRSRRDGELERLRHGAYRPVPPARQDEHAAETARRRAKTVVRAVHRQLGADHVFSHETAALVHGFRLWAPPGTTHVIQGYRRSGAAAGDLTRHRMRLEPGQRTTVDRLPVTSLERTVVDCALTMHPLEALVISDHALARGLDLDACRELLGRTRRRNGVARARWILEHADDGSDSAWETWLRYVSLRAGLPRPVTQAAIPTAARVYHCDLGWPAWNVYAEFDGLAKYRAGGVRPGHDPRQELLREKERFDAIRATGVNPVRVVATSNARLAKVIDALAARFPDHLRRTFRADPLLPLPPMRDLSTDQFGKN